MVPWRRQKWLMQDRTQHMCAEAVPLLTQPRLQGWQHPELPPSPQLTTFWGQPLAPCSLPWDSLQWCTEIVCWEFYQGSVATRVQNGSLQGLASVELGKEGVCINKRILWQWAGSSGPKSTELLSEEVTIGASTTWKISHSSNFLPLTSIHYPAHSIEGWIIESGHPVEGTTILPGMQ